MELILYHGTSSILVPKILREGLLPRKDTGQKSNWDYKNLPDVYGWFEIDSLPDRVYLTRDIELAESLGEQAVKIKGGKIVIFEVRIKDRKRLAPDEDSHRSTWQESLEELNRCAYVGRIPNKNLRLVS